MHHFYYLDGAADAFWSSETKRLQRDGCVLVASLWESSQVWISAQPLARGWFGYSLSASVQIEGTVMPLHQTQASADSPDFPGTCFGLIYSVLVTRVG